MGMVELMAVVDGRLILPTGSGPNSFSPGWSCLARYCCKIRASGVRQTKRAKPLQLEGKRFLAKTKGRGVLCMLQQPL